MEPQRVSSPLRSSSMASAVSMSISRAFSGSPPALVSSFSLEEVDLGLVVVVFSLEEEELVLVELVLLRLVMTGLRLRTRSS